MVGEEVRGGRLVNSKHQRLCYACGTPCEMPFHVIYIRSGALVLPNGKEACVCGECRAKILENPRVLGRDDAEI